MIIQVAAITVFVVGMSVFAVGLLFMLLDERNGYPIDTYVPPSNETTQPMNYDTVALTRLADDDRTR